MKSKNKKAKLISVSLLALCFSMLAFGVYALKQATLTVQGTIGFTAHDCMVRVSATIAGDAVVNGEPNADGAPSAVRTFFTEKTLGTQSKDLTLNSPTDIPDIYFSDLTETGDPETILITFTITNDSFYPITASISNTMLTNTAVTQNIANASKTLEANASDTLTIAFNLGKTEVEGVLDYVDFSDFAYSVRLDFAKYNAVAPVEPQEPAQEINFSTVPQANVLEEWPDELDVWVSENIPNASYAGGYDPADYGLEDLAGLFDEESLTGGLKFIQYNGATAVGVNNYQFFTFDTVEHAQTYEAYVKENFPEEQVERNGTTVVEIITNVYAEAGSLRTWVASGNIEATTENALNSAATTEFGDVYNTIVTYSQGYRNYFSAGEEFNVTGGVLIQLPESTQTEQATMYVFDNKTDADNFYANREEFYENLNDPSSYYATREVIRVNDNVVAIMITSNKARRAEYNEKFVSYDTSTSNATATIKLYVNNEVVETVTAGEELSHLMSSTSDFENAYIEVTATANEGYDNLTVNVDGEPITPNEGKYTIVVNRAGTFNINISASESAESIAKRVNLNFEKNLSADVNYSVYKNGSLVKTESIAKQSDRIDFSDLNYTNSYILFTSNSNNVGELLVSSAVNWHNGAKYLAYDHTKGGYVYYLTEGGNYSFSLTTSTRMAGLSNVTFNSETLAVSFDAVSETDEYEVMFCNDNGAVYFTYPKTNSFTLDTNSIQNAGTYRAYVRVPKVYDENLKEYKATDWSYLGTVTITALSDVTGISLNTETKTLTYTAVENATSYEVSYISEQTGGTFNAGNVTSVSLESRLQQVGTYTIKVRALGNNACSSWVTAGTITVEAQAQVQSAITQNSTTHYWYANFDPAGVEGEIYYVAEYYSNETLVSQSGHMSYSSPFKLNNLPENAGTYGVHILAYSYEKAEGEGEDKKEEVYTLVKDYGEIGKMTLLTNASSDPTTLGTPVLTNVDAQNNEITVEVLEDALKYYYLIKKKDSDYYIVQETVDVKEGDDKLTFTVNVDSLKGKDAGVYEVYVKAVGDVLTERGIKTLYSTEVFAYQFEVE